MTPSDDTHFRNQLGQSSGLHSWQYRLIGYMLGNRNHAMVKPHRHRSQLVQTLEAELSTPSFYEEVLRLAHRKGVNMPPEVLDRDIRQTHQFKAEVMEAWATVYCAPEPHWQFYEAVEKLVDFEDCFRRWRFNISLQSSA